MKISQIEEHNKEVIRQEERKEILKIIENEEGINKDFLETTHKTKKETLAYNEGWKDALDNVRESIEKQSKEKVKL